MLKDKFLASVRRYHLFHPGETVTAAVSGGADSMCLLSVLCAYTEALEIRVAAVHVNHGIRGAEADRDEAFVREYCDRIGVPLTVFHIEVPAEAAHTGESVELCARRMRYALFDQLDTDKIATAHTASDAAETLLMNLSRGSGLVGLCSIPMVRGRIVRPLLDCFREETEQYCSANGVPFVTDSTNESDLYTRNRVRRQVIPALKKSFPAFDANVLRCLRLLREDEDFLSREAGELYESAVDHVSGALQLKPLISAPYSLRSRALARFVSDYSDSDAEEKHYALLDAHLHDAHYALTLPGSAVAEIVEGILRFRSQAPTPAPLQPIELRRDENRTVQFGNQFVHISVVPWPLSSDFSGKRVFAVDFSKIDDIIILRSRAAGDRISLQGRGCSKTLKKYYNERKLPPEFRERAPVLADSRGVIFAQYAGTDASRAPDENTKTVLLVEIKQIVKLEDRRN